MTQTIIWRHCWECLRQLVHLHILDKAKCMAFVACYNSFFNFFQFLSKFVKCFQWLCILCPMFSVSLSKVDLISSEECVDNISISETPTRVCNCVVIVFEKTLSGFVTGSSYSIVPFAGMNRRLIVGWFGK